MKIEEFGESKTKWGKSYLTFLIILMLFLRNNYGVVIERRKYRRTFNKFKDFF